LPQGIVNDTGTFCCVSSVCQILILIPELRNQASKDQTDMCQRKECLYCAIRELLKPRQNKLANSTRLKEAVNIKLKEVSESLANQQDAYEILIGILDCLEVDF